MQPGINSKELFSEKAKLISFLQISITSCVELFSFFFSFLQFSSRIVILVMYEYLHVFLQFNKLEGIVVHVSNNDVNQVTNIHFTHTSYSYKHKFIIAKVDKVNAT